MSSYLYALDTANKRPLPIKVDSDGNLQVDVVSMSGGGDATAAKQDAAKAVLDNILTKNGEIETTADAILAKNTEIETTANSILSKNTEIETTADAILAKNTEIETTADAILAKNGDIETIISALKSANHSDLSAIQTSVAKVEHGVSQSTLINNALITDGSNSSEIEMGDYPHLTLYGETDLQYGNWCLVRNATSGGTSYPDPMKLFSAEEVVNSSGIYNVAITFENIGSQYVAIRNIAGQSQTATIFAVKHR